MRRPSWRAQIKTRFRTLRASHGLSQLETSVRADIPQPRYWRIENGYTTPEKSEEARLARVFKMSVTAFRETIPHPEVIGER